MFGLKRSEPNSHNDAPLSCALPDTARCAMALSLDLEAQTERILVGELSDIARYFEGYTPAASRLLADETRPLGTMVEEMFHSRPLDIVDAATGFRPETVKNRPDLLEKGIRVVEELYASDNLVWRFVALRLWQECRAVKGLPDTAEIGDQLDAIIYPVHHSHETQIKSWNTVYHTDLLQFLGKPYFDYPAYIMYQGGRPLKAYHVTDLSVLPLYVHYLNTVYTEQAFFQYCKRCGRLYIAHTAKIKGFCSEDCRRAQQKENRQRYSDKVEDDEAEKSYRTTYMYWYNRLKKLRQSPGIKPEKLAELEAAFRAFRKEGTIRKGQVQDGEKDMREYTVWLLEQRDYFDRLIEGTVV